MNGYNVLLHEFPSSIEPLKQFSSPEFNIISELMFQPLTWLMRCFTILGSNVKKNWGLFPVILSW